MATTRKKPQTEIIIDENATADIRETVHADGKVTKVLSYQAPIKQNETTENDDENENQDEIFDSEMFNPAMVIDIPKDKIDEFFDDIDGALNNPSDNFFIRVLRTPDNFDDNFALPCRDLTSLGLFGCRLTERYKILNLLQKNNNNSGGRFNLVALDSNQQPLQKYAGYIYERNQRVAQTVAIVARDVFVPNPVKEETPTGHNSNDLTKVLEVMQENNRQMLAAIQQNQKGKSTKEFLEELVLMKEALGAGQNNSNFEDKMLQFMMMPQLADKWASRMFPAPEKPIPPAERTMFDKVIEALNQPIVSNTLEKITDAVDIVIASKIAPPANNNPQWQPPVSYPNPQELPAETETEEKDEMQIIIESLIVELESDKPINETNETIKDLQSKYANQFGLVTMMCKNAPFDDVLQMLITQSTVIQPYPFAPFIDAAAMKAGGNKEFIYTERGKRAVERLREVYEFLRQG